MDQRALRPAVALLRHALVAPVLAVEEHGRRPVVAQILDERARRARALGHGIVAVLHRDVERVAADDLVQMGGVALARVDDWVRPLYHELPAREPQHVLCRRRAGEQRRRRQSEVVMHGGRLVLVGGNVCLSGASQQLLRYLCKQEQDHSREQQGKLTTQTEKKLTCPQSGLDALIPAPRPGALVSPVPTAISTTATTRQTIARQVPTADATEQARSRRGASSLSAGYIFVC